MTPVASPGSRRGDRQGREARGRRAESIAGLWLRIRGYRILRRRLKTPLGEIDILARRGPVLAVVEVKARQTQSAALLSLSMRQRQRIARAAAWHVASAPEVAGCTIRFDVVVIRPRRLPLHIENAWTGEIAGL